MTLRFRSSGIKERYSCRVFPDLCFVIPAQMGIQMHQTFIPLFFEFKIRVNGSRTWFPAFTGMTRDDRTFLRYSNPLTK